MQNNIETNINVEFNDNEKEISDIVENNTNIETKNIEQDIDITKNNNTNEKSNLIQDFLEMITKKLQQKEQLENQEQLKDAVQEEIQQEKTLVIDRFEGDFAVCENRETLEMENIEISKLPQNIKQGDVIKSKNSQYELDEQLKSEIEERIKNKMKNLFND